MGVERASSGQIVHFADGGQAETSGQLPETRSSGKAALEEDSGLRWAAPSAGPAKANHRHQWILVA